MAPLSLATTVRTRTAGTVPTIGLAAAATLSRSTVASLPPLSIPFQLPPVTEMPRWRHGLPPASLLTTPSSATGSDLSTPSAQPLLGPGKAAHAAARAWVPPGTGWAATAAAKMAVQRPSDLAFPFSLMPASQPDLGDSSHSHGQVIEISMHVEFPSVDQ